MLVPKASVELSYTIEWIVAKIVSMMQRLRCSMVEMLLHLQLPSAPLDMVSLHTHSVLLDSLEVPVLILVRLTTTTTS